jgi:hypothetical protein
MAAAVVLVERTPMSAQTRNPFADYVKTPLFETPYLRAGEFAPVPGPNNISIYGEWLGTQWEGDAGNTTIHTVVKTQFDTTFPFGRDGEVRPVEINRYGVVIANRNATALIRSTNGSIVSMPDRIAIAINVWGDVLTMAPKLTPDQPDRAWIRDASGAERELSILTSTYVHFTLTDMNDDGDVIGFVSERDPVYNSWRVSPTLFRMRSLEGVPRILHTFAYRPLWSFLNNAGQIAVTDYRGATTGSFGRYSNSFLWDNGVVTDLAPDSPLTDVTDITDDGRLLLFVFDGRPYPLQVYDHGQRYSLEPLMNAARSTRFVAWSEDGTLFGRDYLCTNAPPGQSPVCSMSFFRASAGTEIADLTATVVNRRVRLSWTPPRDATITSYLIEATLTPGGPIVRSHDTGSPVPSFSVEAPDGKYYIRVRPKRGEATGAASNQVEVVVPGCSVPQQPTGLTATVSGTLVTLNWRSVAAAESYYLLASYNGTLIGFDTGSLSTSYQTFAPPGVYRVRVQARNACAWSPNSAELEIIVGCADPTRPTLAATVAGRMATLSWGPAAPSGTSYTMLAGSRPGLADLAAFPVVGTSFTAPPPPGTYYVRLRAENACGNTVTSNEVVLTIGGS